MNFTVSETALIQVVCSLRGHDVCINYAVFADLKKKKKRKPFTLDFRLCAKSLMKFKKSTQASNLLEVLGGQPGEVMVMLSECDY